MRIKVLNESGNNASIIFDGNEYNFDNDNCIFLETENNYADIIVKKTEISSVHINIIDLLLGTLIGNGSVTIVNCDYSFALKCNENYQVTLKENRLSPNEQFVYSSFCAMSNNAEISDERYSVIDYKRIKKKHKLIHLFLLSALPLEILLVLLSIIFLDNFLMMFLPVLLLFLFFTLPSFKQISRFKKRVNNEYINEILLEQCSVLRNPESSDINKQDSKFDNFIKRILDKMFR